MFFFAYFFNYINEWNISFQNYYDQGDSNQTYENAAVAATSLVPVDKKIDNDLELVGK